MGWQHVRGDFLTITQQKTGTEVSIPVMGRFADVLASAGRENLTFLMTAYGAPFTEAGFTNWFRDMVKEATRTVAPWVEESCLCPPRRRGPQCHGYHVDFGPPQSRGSADLR